ncbi:hypothetical protein MBLNU230_g1291t1 [Neophaeotheca triangularis]
MAPSFSLPDARRIRSYILRLPLATRLLFLILTGFYIATLFAPGLEQWGSLIPSEINIQTLYRMNTYPLLHVNFFHYLLNLIALIPLLERFEAENGTITTLLLFTGPFGLLPGGLYTLIERFILQSNTAVYGASVFVFLLLCSEAIKTYRQNPHFTISTYSIPTWTSPLILILVIHFLVPATSLLGHLCGGAVGYLWGLGWIRFLAPNEKILRWIEGKLNLLGRLPHYVSVDQKTYGRYGVLPSTNGPRVGPGRGTLGAANGVATGPTGSTQRLGP